MRDYLYDRINMLERENHLLRELDNCRRTIDKLNKELAVEKNNQIATRIKLLELMSTYNTLCTEKSNMNRKFDRELATQLSHDKKN